MLYLRGISTGDFQEALAALLGTDAPNLSPGEIWQADSRAAAKAALNTFAEKYGPSMRRR